MQKNKQMDRNNACKTETELDRSNLKGGLTKGGLSNGTKNPPIFPRHEKYFFSSFLPECILHSKRLTSHSPGLGPRSWTRSKDFWPKITEFDLKRVHMARYGLVSKQDGAMWLRIRSRPLSTLKPCRQGQK